MTPKQIVHESAKRLKEIALGHAEQEGYESFHPGVGICTNIRKVHPWCGFVGLHRCRAILNAAIFSWPKHSEDSGFPIPGGGDAYHEHQIKDAQWNTDSEYGRLRFELLDWIIEETKE